MLEKNHLHKDQVQRLISISFNHGEHYRGLDHRHEEGWSWTRNMELRSSASQDSLGAEGTVSHTNERFGDSLLWDSWATPWLRSRRACKWSDSAAIFFPGWRQCRQGDFLMFQLKKRPKHNFYFFQYSLFLLFLFQKFKRCISGLLKFMLILLGCSRVDASILTEIILKGATNFELNSSNI
jgi:hypothetical protein